MARQRSRRIPTRASNLIEIKPHLGWQGGVPNCDSGLDGVWLKEPGFNGLVALAHRQPEGDLICLVPLSESQIEDIKKELRERDCEKTLDTIRNGNGDYSDDRPVLKPLPPLPEASDTDEEDDDE